MRSVDVLSAIMKKHSIKKATLAMRLGVSPQAVNDRFKAKDGKVAQFVQSANALNYKVVVMPAETRIKSDWYEVTVDEE